MGDNIYYCDPVSGMWHQADSHHSNVDGSINQLNLARDTKSDKVLISRYFFYFGSAAACVPSDLLKALGFKNQRGHRTYREKHKSIAEPLIAWLESRFSKERNRIIADPFDFAHSEKRYSGR